MDITDLKNKKISALILEELAASGCMKSAINKILGEGTYEKIRDELYDELKAKALKA